jgi:segregation and condensation protein B
MSLKAKVEAIIYAAEEPVTLEQIALLLKDIVLADLASAKENAAIEQADSDAEAAATASDDGALMPEFAPQAADLIFPEPGPLTPPQPTAPADAGQPENTIENTADEESRQEESSPGFAAEETPPDATEIPAGATEPAAEALAHEDGESSPTGPQAVSPTEEPAPAESASVDAPETTSRKRQPKKTEKEIAEDKAVRARVREVLVELITDYAHEDRGMEIRQVAGGFRMATKPEHHDVVRAFAKSLKPPIRLSLAALETLAVIAYKQPITAPEIADIRSVESASVLGTLLDRKLITTAGRKQVIGRPMLYKTSKDFLLRFGLNDVNELPSMEEFSQLASDGTIEIAPSEPQDSLSLFEPEAQSSAAPPAAPGGEAESQAAPQAQNVESRTESENVESKNVESVESKDLEANHQGSHIPELQQPDAAEPADSQPESEAESSNVPEAEHPIGHKLAR